MLVGMMKCLCRWLMNLIIWFLWVLVMVMKLNIDRCCMVLYRLMLFVCGYIGMLNLVVSSRLVMFLLMLVMCMVLICIMEMVFVCSSCLKMIWFWVCLLVVIWMGVMLWVILVWLSMLLGLVGFLI